jgi:anti-sigma B factor antagonist
VTASTRRVDNITIIDLRGRITLGAGTGELRELVREAMEHGPNIILNLSGVDYVDSAGLGEMVGAYTTVANRGGAVKLLNPQKKLDGLLQLTKLYTVFETFNDEAEAVRSFEQAAGA